MRIFKLKTSTAIAALAVAAVSTAIAIPAATAAPLVSIAAASKAAAPNDGAAAHVTTVGYKRYRKYRKYHSRRSYGRRYYRDHDVDAPYTRYRRGGRVHVDAPYAHVRRDRHGVRVRAPYVDLYIPRY